MGGEAAILFPSSRMRERARSTGALSEREDSLPCDAVSQRHPRTRSAMQRLGGLRMTPIFESWSPDRPCSITIPCGRPCPSPCRRRTALGRQPKIRPGRIWRWDFVRPWMLKTSEPPRGSPGSPKAGIGGESVNRSKVSFLVLKKSRKQPGRPVRFPGPGGAARQTPLSPSNQALELLYGRSEEVVKHAKLFGRLVLLPAPFAASKCQKLSCRQGAGSPALRE
jgi:hypothetical protein